MKPPLLSVMSGRISFFRNSQPFLPLSKTQEFEYILSPMVIALNSFAIDVYVSGTTDVLSLVNPFLEARLILQLN